MANQTNKSGSGSSFGESASHTASHTMDKGKEQATGVMDKAKDIAGNVVDKAKDIGSAAVSGAGNAASWVGQRADDAVTATGSGMRNLGETIRDKGPQGGFFGGAASAIGGAMETGGEYLERGFSGIGGDLSSLIRRNPVVSCLIGVGLGFVLARLTSSNRS